MVACCGTLAKTGLNALSPFAVVSILLSLAGGAFAQEPGGKAALDYTVQVETAHKELDDSFYWFHPYLTPIPGSRPDGPPDVILLTQKHLSVDDHYSNTFVLRTHNLGKTWSKPQAVPQLKWLSDEGYDRSIASIVPKWHAKTGKLLAIGHSNVHDRPTGFVNKAGATWIYYTIYDPKLDQWRDWQPLGAPGEGNYASASGCSQWMIQPDGTILLPTYVKTEKDKPWAVRVYRCRFDGERLETVESGNLLVHEQSRGIHEPSLTKYDGRYWLTIRSDESAFVSTSKDGLEFEPLVEWKFDDGAVLGSHNTQQHWVTHSDGLFVVYTRRGANNDHIARNRAPLFMARVDPAKQVVIRSTERVLIPERGVAMGNFGAADISPDETWVSVGENMWPYQGKLPTDKGAEGAILIARIRWNRPNASAAR